VRRRDFGSLRKLPSGRWQAVYTGPDGQRHKAGTTFDDKTTANLWLRRQQAAIADGSWGKPAPARREVPRFAAYAASWLATRPLRGRSVREYRSVLHGHLIPAFGAMRLDEITPLTVRQWHASYGTRTPSARAKAYRVLHAIMATAADDDRLVGANPCRVRRGGSDPRQRRINVATPEEVAEIAGAVRPQWRMLVLLAAWTTLRFGELSELRRSDVDLEAGVLMVTRAVSRTDEGLVADRPKSEAGIRDVAVPPFLLGDLAAHLLAHAQPGPDGLLFTAPGGGQLYQSCMFRDWDRARTQAGRPDLRFHDLRHTGATWAAEEGATTKQLMRRLGHANPTMAMLYQHATDRGDAQVAERLSQRGAKVIDLGQRVSVSDPGPQRRRQTRGR
jgi:integrase